MSRIRIVKKNDEYTSEYQVGDLFEIVPALIKELKARKQA